MTSNALQPAAANADITATLRALGLIEPEGQGLTSINRANLNGASIELGEDTFPTNQKTKAPAFYGRILDLPDEYQGVFLTEDDADILERPDIAGRFCKSHYNPERYPNEAASDGRSGAYAEDGTECRKCPIMPFIPKDKSPLENNKKCQWRGDITFQRCEQDGTTLDERTWTLSLPTTGMIELKGARKEPEKGYITERNFMFRLVDLAIATWPDMPPAAAIQRSAVALASGGVVAAFRAIQFRNANSMSFPVVALEPVAIIEDLVNAPDTPALPAEAAKNVTPSAEADEDDLPF